MGKKILVAMSGGVDSSVTALLLTRRGYDCIGVTMKLYEGEAANAEGAAPCCSEENIADARSAAEHIGIPFEAVSYQADFDRQVIQRFISTYENGGTPNPCIDCNRYLKFGRLYQLSQELGCDYIATGHYARILQDPESGLYQLHTGPDARKDQSYVLYSLTQQQLAHTLFPLGEMEKEQVRQIAEEAGLLNAHKHDSEDICFVPDKDYAAFIERYTGKTYAPGNFVDTEGKVLGRHNGIVHYTLGQRKGLGVAAGKPVYVIKKDLAANTVVLGSNEDLMCSAFTAAGVNWCSGVTPQAPLHAEVCTRYQSRRVPALLQPQKDGSCLVTTDAPLRAVTPGQAAVFYSGTQVLGGGTIV